MRPIEKQKIRLEILKLQLEIANSSMIKKRRAKRNSSLTIITALLNIIILIVTLVLTLKR